MLSSAKTLVGLSPSDCSASGVGERLAYFQTELNLVLFLPFPGTVPSSSAKGSSSKRDPYDVLDRLTNAGDEKTPSSAVSWSIRVGAPFIVGIGGGVDLEAISGGKTSTGGSGSGSRSACASGAGWSISIDPTVSAPSVRNYRSIVRKKFHFSGSRSYPT